MSLILVVEDEKKIREKVAAGLQKDGFQVEVIGDAESFSPDVVLSLRPAVTILDRLLGAKDSLDAIDEIKSLHPAGGILILSAIDSPLEKAKALEAGADDYLAKPFSMTELLARVKALQRRMGQGGRPAFLKIGRSMIDVDGRSIIVAGKRHHLSNKEFGILRVLAAFPGRVFNKNQLLDAVWDSAFDVESNAVETAMTSLRRRLEDIESGIVIKNMRNVGYWVEAEGL